jgi:hypothetical protein
MPKRKKKYHHHHVREEFWLVFAIVLGVMFGFCAALIVYAPDLSPNGSIIVGGGASVPTFKQARVSPGEAARVQLLADMRQLWNADAVWTRQYIFAYVAGTGDYEEAFSRLQQNSDAMVNVLAAYYGPDVEPSFGVAMKERIGLLSDYLAAAKRGDETAMAAAETKWQENSNSIARQLSAFQSNGGIGPMLSAYQSGTATEINFRVGKKWSDDAAAAVSVNEQGMVIADMITQGIVAQFPEKF